MKVKELTEIFKVSSEELLQLLENVGVDITLKEETFVDASTEKKLAARYKVKYPFKSSKAKAPVAPKKVEVKTTKPLADTPATKTAQPVKTASNKPATVKKEVADNPKNQTVNRQQPVNENRGQNNSNKPKSNERVVHNNNNNNNRNKNITNTNNSPNNYKSNNKPASTNAKQSSTAPVVNKTPDKPVVSVKPKLDEIVAPRVDEATFLKYGDFLEVEEYNITKENWTGRKKQGGDDASAKKKNSNKNKQSRSFQERRTSNIPTKSVNEANVVYYEVGMTVQMLAEEMNIRVTDLVKKLFVSMGILATATQSIDRDTAELIAIEYNYELKDKQITDMTRFDEILFEDDEVNLVIRPAVVTIMGHVDHGKTTLLDTIRSSHVVTGEAGGITQHIGAYQVNKNGKLITFIDTPGHSAFTEMRARGAQITDIVILVVAADDGVMPQTKEAIEHAQAAGVPIIVAINKMDRPGANPDRIKQELTEYKLVAEEWGGDTIYVPISALTGKGVDELLEMIILSSDLKEYKANPNRLGMGTVIEAKLTKGRGAVATLLVQNGTLKVGDIIVVGNTYGKIRAMNDEHGNAVMQAGPSKPVEITGITEVPFAGEKFLAINDERKAREIAETRSINKFNEEKGVGKGVTLTDIYKNQDDAGLKNLNLIIKCDVQGSIEAIRGLLDKILIEGTKINIISARVGGINDNDISLAIASNAIIIGFNIRPTAQITDMAKDKGIEIRLYTIIYKLQEDIEKAVKGMLDPVFGEKVTGQVEVRQIFKATKIGTIAGSYVTNGVIYRNGNIRVIRDQRIIYTGKIGSLQHLQNTVKEVKYGFECGITVENFNDIKVGDILECYIMEEIERE